MYKIAFDPSFQDIINKLKKREPQSYNNVISKIKQIAIILETNTNHCKNLRAP
jgi:mRNA-degrading endonuclease RelE of RelBE toxin-antitoxin system